jgi:hypothetical protein
VDEGVIDKRIARRAALELTAWPLKNVNNPNHSKNFP